jgi:hypothetical protein
VTSVIRPIKHDRIDAASFAEVVAPIHVEHVEDLCGKVPHVGYGGASKSKYVSPKSGRTIFVLERNGMYAPDAFSNEVWHFERDFTVADAATFLKNQDSKGGTAYV